MGPEISMKIIPLFQLAIIIYEESKLILVAWDGGNGIGRGLF